ncbi:hypothetical protein [Streptomyces sp. H39-S7]|uniref:hypothetical protein n=1 Tax=Streptomyces sp. H39-S7 TaxID=3004357 RepID=UPI0022AEBAD2|nr:hypothetical protein [Streptomyces sp. H39-S7]MCZ4117925.1 hypothetical protein [Streptomyces sp. H39-S7]
MATERRSWKPDWRRMDCLADCGELVKRARHSWVEIGGTRSGSWLIGTRVDVGRAFADPLPPPDEEQLFMLGTAHRSCIATAVALLRERRAQLTDDLTVMNIEPITGHHAHENWLPAPPGRCPFCSDPEGQLTDEDIYPKWLVREMKQHGVRSTDPQRRRISWPTTPVCQHCNNTWMSTLENDVKDVLIPMFHQVRSLDEYAQGRLALWAAKMAVILDAAGGNIVPHRAGQRLEIHRQPHDGMRVWITAYHDASPLALVSRPIYMPGKDPRDELLGLCVTFSVVKVAFQVFIPFLDGDLAPLEDFHGSVLQIWPTTCSVLDWPPPFRFDQTSIQALAARINDNREDVTMEVNLSAAERVSRAPSEGPG